MKFHLPFLIFIVSSMRGNAGNSTSSSSRVVQMLHELCPGANICQENQTTQVHFKTYQPGLKSCCTECSCGLDCEKDRNCCFPRAKTQQQADDMALERRTLCLFPTTVQPSVETRFLYQSYNMISSVPKPKKYVDDIKSNTNASCGDDNVAPWGSLYPVYSVKLKRIYKNMGCAADDEVEDGKLWDAELICDTVVDDMLLDASSFVLGLNSNFIQNNCQVNFLFQGDSKEIRPLVCYVDPIDTCSASEFQISDDINASKEEITEACTNGLVSPYRHSANYANVFCHICNAEVFWKDTECETFTDQSARSDKVIGFKGLIDGRFITDGREGHLKGAPIYPRACPRQAVKNLQILGCRTVFCPSGQLHDRAGKCRYLNKLWYDQVYTIFVNLQAEEYINIEEVFRVKRGDMSYTLPNFDSPWQKNWLIHLVLYEDFRENKNITKFLVVLRIKLSKVQPNRLVTNIKTMANRQWLLRHNNVTIVLQSSIMNFVESVLYRNKESTILIGNHSESILKPNYHLIYRREIYSRNELYITKLYMCDQVELTQPEFILSKDKTVLFNIITTKFLFDGEFTLIISNTVKGLRARVCIEDSGLYSPGQVSHEISLFNTYPILLLVVVGLFWIVA